MPHWPNGNFLNSQSFTYLLNNPEQIHKEQHLPIADVISSFPYFQAARALQLKALKDAGSFKYNAALKTTAAYTADRSVLFDFITSDTFKQHQVAKRIQNREAEVNQIELVEVEEITPDKPQELEEKLKSELRKAQAILDPELFAKKQGEESISNQVEETEDLNEQPLEFSEEDCHSFNVWLSLTQVKPIAREDSEQANPKTKKKEQKFKLIDKFLQEQPKIDPTNQVPSSKNLAKPFTKPTDSLMTATLAKVYTQQKNYKKAIQAYKILSLKNPEKSGFFADQIRAIEKLIAQSKAQNNDNV